MASLSGSGQAHGLQPFGRAADRATKRPTTSVRDVRRSLECVSARGLTQAFIRRLFDELSRRLSKFLKNMVLPKELEPLFSR
jgi:hypothetical protein